MYKKSRGLFITMLTCIVIISMICGSILPVFAELSEGYTDKLLTVFSLETEYPILYGEVGNQTELQTALNNAADKSRIVIKNSITLTSSLIISRKNIDLALVAKNGTVMLNLDSGMTNRHIIISGNVKLAFTGVEIIGHKPALGGGIEVRSENVILDGPIIRNCANIRGGAIAFYVVNNNDLDRSTKFTLNDGIISGNVANMGGGIAAYYRNSNMLFKNTIITENRASYEIGPKAQNEEGAYGGGIYAWNQCDIILENCTISKNEAEHAGGGIGVEGFGIGIGAPYGIIRLTNTKIDSNSANIGGGIRAYHNTKVQINSGGEITNNAAVGDGGGMHLSNTNQVEMTGGKISGNRAANGGGIYTLGEIIINDGEISKNVASIDGGGIFSFSYSDGITINDGEISKNVANRNGGGICTYARNELKVTSSGVVFNENEAATGYSWDINDPTIISSNIRDLHKTNIKSTAFSLGSSLYNNYDIYFTAYSLTYDANGGSGTVAAKYYPPGATVKVAVNTFTAPGGRSFAGWGRSAYSPASYLPDDIFTIGNTDAILYAVWARNNKIIYHANGGSGFMADEFFAYGAAATVAANGFSAPTGKTFDYWSTKADGSGTKYAPNDTFAMGSSNITLYAIWKKDISAYAELYVICKDQNGSTIYQRTTSEIVGDTVNAEAPKIIGYDLDDQAEKSIMIKESNNILEFKYKQSSQLIFDLYNHIQYINGYPDGTVKPDSYITRAEAASIFYRLLLTDEEEQDNIPANIFKDIKGDEWYAEAVNYLAKYGVILGYDEGTFKPNKTITRAEFAAMASRFDKLEDLKTSVFTDVPAAHWASKYINSAVEKGWVSGFPDKTFKPDEGITRVQVVTIVNRMLDRKITIEGIPEAVTQYSDITPSHWGYCDIIEASVTHEYKRQADGSEIWE